MILIDVYVPALNATYDFQLDETVPIRLLFGELVEILQRKATGAVDPDSDASGYVLCSADTAEILDPELTLAECGICNGKRLLLV